MKILKNFLIGLVAFFALLIAALYIFKVGYLITAVRITYLNGHKTAFLDDYNYFENRIIEKSKTPQSWPISAKYNSASSSNRLDSLHAKNGTVAYLITKNDSIQYEHYYDNYEKNSKSNSFSMAKSVVSAALGKAVQEGKIKNLDQLVGDFIPEFSAGKASTLTVGDLSSMASGLNWDESYYSPFSVTTQAYFDKDLPAIIKNLRVTSEPGKHFIYLSGNTQLLAMVIEKATGKSLANYVSEKFWQPMGAENDALWQTDQKDGIVKAYCCIASNARDFSRFGKLYKQFGRWEGKQILDSAFVAKSITPRFKDAPDYGYGWWLAKYQGKDVFYMRGHLGQYVIVIPEDDIIITRLGHRATPVDGDEHGKDFYIYIEEAYKMLEQMKS